MAKSKALKAAADAAEEGRAGCVHLQFACQFMREGPEVGASARALSADAAEEVRAGCNHLQFIDELTWYG